MKDVPKNYRPNFAKFIIWQEGTGQQNISNQKNKLQQLLSNTIKISIQKKIEQFHKQISSLQSLQLNQKILKNLFVSRSKIASIYKQLKLTQISNQHYSNLFNEILSNYKKFFGTVSSKQINMDKLLYKSPFIVKDINKIFGYFDTKSNFLHITNFCFIKMLESHLQLVQYYEGMKKFKTYIDFVLNNILSQISSRQEDISRNLWIIDTIDEIYKILRQKGSVIIGNPVKQQEYSLINVSVCSQYRNAIERIGIIFYGLNTYIVFPRNLQYELELCIKSMKNISLTEQQYPQMKTLNRHQEVNKLLFLSGQPISQTIQLILNNFDTYKIIYVKTLQLMQKILQDSHIKKWKKTSAQILYYKKIETFHMKINSFQNFGIDFLHLMHDSPFNNDIQTIKLCFSQFQARQFSKLQYLFEIVLSASTCKNLKQREVLIAMCSIFIGIYLQNRQEGLLYAKLNHYENKKNILRQQTLLQHLGFSYYNLAKSEIDLENRQIYLIKALENHKKSQDINPNNQVVTYCLAKIYLKLYDKTNMICRAANATEADEFHSPCFHVFTWFNVKQTSR